MTLDGELLDAISAHSVTDIEDLIRRGANVNVWDDIGSTPLSRAVTSDRLEVVECLLKNHADLAITDSHGWSVLHHAATRPVDSRRCMTMLMEAGADVNADDLDGRTPLHCAALEGLMLQVSFLLDHGAIKSTRDNDGRTALQLAEERQHDGVLQVFSSYGPTQPTQVVDTLPSPPSPEEFLAMIDRKEPIAIQAALKAAPELVDTADSRGQTALHHAAVANSLPVMEAILAATPVLDTPAADGRTALRMCYAGSPVEARLTEQLAAALGRLVALADHGTAAELSNFKEVGLKSRDKAGRTMLMVAIDALNVDTVSYLLSVGSGPPLHLGWSPVTVWLRAAVRLPAHPNVCQVGRLLYAVPHSEGVYRTAQPDPPRAPVPVLAAETGQVRVVEIVMANHKGDVNDADIYGRTALMAATAAGHNDIVKLLLVHGADPFKARPDGTSALLDSIKGTARHVMLTIARHAAGHPPKNGALLLHAVATAGVMGLADVVDILAEPLSPDNLNTPVQGVTPLAHAAAAGKVDVVKVLIKRGSLPTAGKPGSRPIDVYRAPVTLPMMGTRPAPQGYQIPADPVQAAGWRMGLKTVTLTRLESLLTHGWGPEICGTCGETCWGALLTRKDPAFLAAVMASRPQATIAALLRAAPASPLADAVARLHWRAMVLLTGFGLMSPDGAEGQDRPLHALLTRTDVGPNDKALAALVLLRAGAHTSAAEWSALADAKDCPVALEAVRLYTGPAQAATAVEDIARSLDSTAAKEFGRAGQALAGWTGVKMVEPRPRVKPTPAPAPAPKVQRATPVMTSSATQTQPTPAPDRRALLAALGGGCQAVCVALRQMWRPSAGSTAGLTIPDSAGRTVLTFYRKAHTGPLSHLHAADGSPATGRLYGLLSGANLCPVSSLLREIDAGADVNGVGTDGTEEPRSMLAAAIDTNHYRDVELLLDCGASPLLMDDRGVLPATRAKDDAKWRIFDLLVSVMPVEAVRRHGLKQVVMQRVAEEEEMAKKVERDAAKGKAMEKEKEKAAQQVREKEKARQEAQQKTQREANCEAQRVAAREAQTAALTLRIPGEKKTEPTGGTVNLTDAATEAGARPAPPLPEEVHPTKMGASPPRAPSSPLPPSSSREHPEARARLRRLITGHRVTELASIIRRHPELVDAPMANGVRPLHQAIAHGAEECVSLLLGAGADVLAPDPTGRVGCQLAPAGKAGNGVRDLLRIYLTEQLLDSFETPDTPVAPFIDAGADVRYASKEGHTALHFAVEYGRVDAVAPLVRAGAVVDAADGFGYTPLLWAVDREWGVPMVRTLLQLGADPNKIDKNGKSPLFWAHAKGKVEVAKLLAENGAKVLGPPPKQEKKRGGRRRGPGENKPTQRQG